MHILYGDTLYDLDHVKFFFLGKAVKLLQNSSSYKYLLFLMYTNKEELKIIIFKNVS